MSTLINRKGSFHKEMFAGWNNFRWVVWTEGFPVGSSPERHVPSTRSSSSWSTSMYHLWHSVSRDTVQAGWDGRGHKASLAASETQQLNWPERSMSVLLRAPELLICPHLLSDLSHSTASWSDQNDQCPSLMLIYIIIKTNLAAFNFNNKRE